MSVRTTVEVDGGLPVVRRVGLGPDAEAVRGRAEALRAAAGPGVVAVVRSGPTDGGWELVTEHGGQPVDAHRLRTAAAVREVGVVLAAVLDRLHAGGQVHGGLAAEHVLVGPAGRPVLDGFGMAAARAPADDVGALADLLLRLVADLPGEPDGRERSARAHLQRTLADGARHGDREPTAAQLGAALRAGPPSAGAPGRRGWPRGAVVGLAAAGAALAVASGRWPAPPPSTGRAPAAPTTASSAPAAPPASLPPCVVDEGASPPGCPHSVVVDGAEVTVDGRRSRFGLEGDELLVGAWGCDGAPRPAVLRPATGEVLVYGGVDVGEPVVVLAERVEGATALAADLDDDGCAALMVVTSEGTVRLA